MAKNNNLHDFVKDLADTIRTKKGYSSTKLINPQDFSDEISTIQTGITPSGNKEIQNKTGNDVYYYATASVKNAALKNSADINITDLNFNNIGGWTFNITGSTSSSFYPATAEGWIELTKSVTLNSTLSSSYYNLNITGGLTQFTETYFDVSTSASYDAFIMLSGNISNASSSLISFMDINPRTYYKIKNIPAPTTTETKPSGTNVATVTPGQNEQYININTSGWWNKNSYITVEAQQPEAKYKYTTTQHLSSTTTYYGSASNSARTSGYTLSPTNTSMGSSVNAFGYFTLPSGSILYYGNGEVIPEDTQFFLGHLSSLHATSSSGSRTADKTEIYGYLTNNSLYITTKGTQALFFPNSASYINTIVFENDIIIAHDGNILSFSFMSLAKKGSTVTYYGATRNIISYVTSNKKTYSMPTTRANAKRLDGVAVYASTATSLSCSLTFTSLNKQN